MQRFAGMGKYEELKVFKISYELAFPIHQQSLTFPKYEQYALADQIRRSSRSTCSNIVEAYRKRRYPKHFISKLSDADSENTETSLWLDFAKRFDYLTKDKFEELKEQCSNVGRLLNFMMKNHEIFS